MICWHTPSVGTCPIIFQVNELNGPFLSCPLLHAKTVPVKNISSTIKLGLVVTAGLLLDYCGLTHGLWSPCPPCSGWSQEPDPYGSKWTLRPLRQAQAHPWPQERDQTEDQDHPFLPQPLLERVIHLVSPPLYDPEWNPETSVVSLLTKNTAKKYILKIQKQLVWTIKITWTD